MDEKPQVEHKIDLPDAVEGDVTVDSVITRDDLPNPPRVSPSAMFGLEHWIHLARTGRAPGAPTYLAPFPMQLHTPQELEAELTEWGYVDGDGRIDPEVYDLLYLVAEGFTHAVWGSIRFPLMAHARRVDVDPELVETGLATEVTVVPKIPFLIGWERGGEVVTAVSTDSGVVISRAEASPEHFADLGSALGAVLDPDSRWPVYPNRPQLRVTTAEMTSVIRDDSVSDALREYVAGPTQTTRRALESSIRSGRDVTETQARLIADEVSAVSAAEAQFVAGIRDPQGNVEMSSTAAGVLFPVNAEVGVRVVIERPDLNDEAEMTFAPATEGYLQLAVKSLLTESDMEINRKNPGWK